ncbi:MAG: hypothetical protein ACI8PZ_007150 [Myxococcota bacterium]|jgi:hypothetical protein
MRPPLIALSLALTACGQRELLREQVCDDAVFAVASRVYQCTGDDALSAEAAKLFEGLDCLYRDPPDSAAVLDLGPADYHCVNALYAATCDSMEANLSNLDWWWSQGTDARCWQLFAEAAHTSPAYTTGTQTGGTY